MAKATADEGCGPPIWSATTNWMLEAGGSLSDAMSYDTSDEIENEQTAKPLLLLRPEGDDPPPCEVTICFRKMHEIHRVYVRSTARVYEIYYSPDYQDSSEEYLCTVHCSAAAREITPEIVDFGATNSRWGNNNGIAARKDDVVRSDSNISDEDGWVQVKAPDSPLQNDKEYPMSKKCEIEMESPIMQTHYEATADISDYSPCVSLKLRLLSIQTKACVHIEEIYVYADPVEPSYSDPPVNVGESMGRSSLLAMLVPSLMRLSKSRGTQDKSFSEEASVSECQYASERTAQTVTSYMGTTAAQEACSGKSPDQKLGTDQEQTVMELEGVHSEPIREVTAPNQMPNSLADENNCQAYSRIQKVLDELVLKVGKVEAFCSKFEDKMLKPLACMEQRLQLVDLKLDALAVKNLSSEQCLCSRVSSLESNEYNSKNKGGNTDLTESKEDTSFIATTSPADEVETLGLICHTHPGLVIKAPEFFNEGDDRSNNEDSSNSLMADLSKQKKHLTIDSALASSLTAFLTSTTVSYFNTIPCLTGITQESVNGSNSYVDSLAGFPSEGAGNSSDKSVIEDNILDAAREGACFGDSSLSCCDYAIVNDEFSSDMKNKSYTSSGFVTEGTTFDDSLSATDADILSPAYTSQEDSGFIIMAPDFLNSSGSFNGDDTLDSPDWEGPELPTVFQGVPPLADFPSSTVLQSTKKISTLFSVPSGLSSIDYNDLSASTDAVPREGADVPGRENHEENAMKGFLDSILSWSPLEASFEQEHHDGLGLKEWLSSKKADRLLVRNLHGHTFSELNAVASENCHSRSYADESDAKDATLHGFIKHGSCYSRSSTDDNDAKDAILHCFNLYEGADVSGRENHEENVMKECLDPILNRSPLEASSEQGHHDGLGLKEWLSSKKTDGLLVRILHDHTFSDLNAVVRQNYCNGSNADDNDAKDAFLHCFNQHDRGFEYSSSTRLGLHENPIKQRVETERDAATGCNQEMPNKVPEDTICNVKFTPERNWISGLPLEVLLGEMQGAELLEPATSWGDEDCRYYSWPTEGTAWEADSVGNFLAEVLPCIPYEDAGI